MYIVGECKQYMFMYVYAGGYCSIMVLYMQRGMLQGSEQG